MRDIIKIRQLVKRFGHFTAVDHISLDVQEGEVFGFLGANGAGKTTTIRMICGLLEPTEGEIYVDDIDVIKNPEAVKQRIGYMSQKFSLYMDLTPFENMEFFGQIYGVSSEIIQSEQEKLSEELGMSNLNRILTRDLPLGHKQRLALRTTLLHDPPILFLDEATSGVDPLGRRVFWDRIYELSHQGKTIFVTTHYMDEAEYCHRIAIMDKGKIVKQGSPRELKTDMGVATMQEVFIQSIQI